MPDMWLGSSEQDLYAGG